MKALEKLVAALFCVAATSSLAQVPDHLKCYKIKDPVKLKAVVDLNSPQFGLEPGCKVSSAKLFCVPASKVVRESSVPVQPVPGEAETQDRLCYKIKCPKPFPPEQEVFDQFGQRVVSGMKPAILCTPAFKVTQPTQPPTTTTTVTVPSTTTTTVTVPSTTTTTQPPVACTLGTDSVCSGDCPATAPHCLYRPALNRCECVTDTEACAAPVGGSCNAQLCPATNQTCVPIGDACICCPGSTACP